MYDKTQILEHLQNIEHVLLLVMERTATIKSVDDFVLTPDGVDKLDATALRLMAVGEEIRKIDNKSKGKLFENYPEIEKAKIIGFRNFVAHAYLDIDAEEVFDAVQNKIKPLLSTIQQIIADLKQ